MGVVVNCEEWADALRTKDPVCGPNCWPRLTAVIDLVIFGKSKEDEPQKLPIRSSPAFKERLKTIAEGTGASLNVFALQMLESGLAIHEWAQANGELLEKLRRKGESRADFVVRLLAAGLERLSRDGEASRNNAPSGRQQDP